MKNTKSIFLIEDDIDDQCFFIEALCEIENTSLYAVANNGKEALDKLNSPTTLPDLIFMDINMPIMNGIECLTEIIKNPQLKNIPVVILSSATEQMEIVHKLGAKAFLKKPPDGKTMRSQLEQMINLDFVTNGQMADQTFQGRFSA
jgi:CheY-like chemotaxis protein